MVLDFQNIPIVFNNGIDTKTAEKQVAPTSLTSLNDATFQRTGSLTKRWGYDSYSNNGVGFVSANSITNGKALSTFNNELLVFDGYFCYSRSALSNGWAFKGNAISTIITNQQIVSNTFSQKSADYAFLNGMGVYAWEDGSGIKYSVYDESREVCLVFNGSITAATTSSRPKVIAFPNANCVCIFYTDVTGLGANHLFMVKIFLSDVIAGNLPAAATVIALNLFFHDSNSITWNLYDVIYGNSCFYIAFYGGSASNAGVTVYQYNAAFTRLNTDETTTALTNPSLGLAAPCLAFDNLGNLWVAISKGNKDVFAFYYSTTSTTLTYHSIFTLATALSAAPSTIVIGWNPVFTTSTMQAYYEIPAASTQNNVINSATVRTTGILTGNSGYLTHAGIGSKPFIVNGFQNLIITYQTTLNGTYYIYGSLGLIGQINPTSSGFATQNNDYMVPEVVQLSTNVYKFAHLVAGQIISENGVLSTTVGVNSTTIDFNNSNQFLTVSLNDNMYLIGGIIQSYDGTLLVEHGFASYPENITLTPASSGGSLGTGNYQYCVVWAYQEENGIQYSTPSVADGYTFLTGSSNKLTVNIPTIGITNKSVIMIKIYRTTANGTLFYEVTSPTSPTLNNSGPILSFIDTMSDAALISNALMYTQPNTVGANPVLPNSSPPSAKLIAVYRNRIFLGGLDNPNQLWYSKEKVPGIPIEFSDQLTLELDADGGPITAIQTLNGSLIIFKKNAIYSLTGQGPTATGDNSDYTDIPRITTTVGCAHVNSIAVTDFGLMFQASNGGFYLLDTGQNCHYVGAPVEAFNSTFVCSSATVKPPQQVIFTSTSGTALVYDYLNVNPATGFGQWAIFTNHFAVDGILDTGNNNLFTYLNPDGYVFVENDTSFMDVSIPIGMGFTTAFLHLASFNGAQRVRKLFISGTFFSAHTLNVNVSYLGVDGYSPETWLPCTPVVVSSVVDYYQYRIDLTIQKCQAIRFQIFDTQSTGQGLSIDSISIEVGMKKGMSKLPATKQSKGT